MNAVAPDGLSVFLSYRRDDSADAAGRLYDVLAGRFGEDRVFMDIDTIKPGRDFEKVVNEAVDSCDVLIAMIGQQWLTIADAKGRRRLDKPDDFVRLEVAAALDRDVMVLPALVQEAEMPSSDELPEALAPLARRHAVELSRARWSHDVGRLTRTLDEVEREKVDRARLARTAAPRWVLVAAVAGGVLIMALLLVWVFIAGTPY